MSQQKGNPLTHTHLHAASLRRNAEANATQAIMRSCLNQQMPHVNVAINHEHIYLEYRKILHVCLCVCAYVWGKRCMKDVRVKLCA